MTVALRAEGLHRRFGSIVALDDVSFEVDVGQTLAVFGPNGAGKSTLLRTLAGLLKPSRGVIYLGGERYDRRRGDLRRRIGWITHQSMLYDGLTVYENLLFAARLYDMPDADQAVRAALERVDLATRRDSPVRTLSRGLVQRTAIARALIHQPSILLLDEPFTGLDIAAAQQFRDLLTEQRLEGHTVVIVTHNIDEGFELATHVAIQQRGRFVEFGSRSDLDRETLTRRYQELIVGA